jgi:hypothetical protein
MGYSVRRTQASEGEVIWRVKQRIKQTLLPHGLMPRTIRAGLLKGLRMELDFAHHTQRWLGLDERELSRWFRELRAGVVTALDVGAHVGKYTLYFLAKTSARRVFAFEPDRQALAALQRNLALNGFASDSRLAVVDKYVGSYQSPTFVSLDSYVERVACPCLVKVDIDGGEVELLRGAQQFLSLPDVRWIIETHAGHYETECARILEARGYRTSIVANAWWRCVLPELRPGPPNRWLIALRESESRHDSLQADNDIWCRLW